MFAASLFLFLRSAAILVGSPMQSLEQHAAQLPAQTIAAYSIQDSERWIANWPTTAIAQYFAEPGMSEWVSNVVTEAEKDNPWLTLIQRHSIFQYLDGQATVALIESGNGIELAVILDVGDSDQFAEFILQLCKDMQQQNAEFKEVNHHGMKLQTITMPDAGRSLLAFAVDNGRFVACSSLNVLQQLVSPGENRLLQTPEFTATVLGATAEMKQHQFWWFFKPLELLKHASTSELKSHNTATKNYQIAIAEGFGAVRAIGGVGSLKRGHSPFLVGQIFAPPPFERSMRLLNLQELQSAQIPDWVAGSSTSLGYLNLRMETVLESFATLFDTVAGEGEAGVFEAVLQDLQSDPQGPKVNLQNEVIGELKTPLYFTTIATGNTTQTIIGIEIRNRDQLANAVGRLYAGDSRAKRLAGLEYDAWQVLPLENNPVGFRKPFVIAIREQFLVIAPDADVIESAFHSAGSSNRNLFAKSLEIDPPSSSFGYAADLNALAKLRHEQLRTSGTLGGLIGTLANEMDLGKSLQLADRSGIPEFESVSKYFPAKLGLRATANASGWRIVIRYQD